MGKADSLLRDVGSRVRESASHRGTPAAMPGMGSGIAATTSSRDAGVVRSKVSQVIRLDRIVRDPSQPREEFDEEALGRLADSLRTQGMIQPITVRWDDAASAGRGSYVVVVGERRWRAAQMAGLESVPCTVNDREFGPGELLALQCVENLLREDLKPIEQAKAFRTLMETKGISGHQLAKELGVSQGAVMQALALLKLPEAVQAIVDDGAIGASSAYVIASKIEDPATQQEVAARAADEGLSRAEVVRVVEESIVARPEAARKPAKGRGAEVKAEGRKSEAKGRGAAEPKSPATKPAPVVYEDDECTITVKWKRADHRPINRVAGDFARWAKMPGAGQAQGQGGESDADAA